MKSTFCYALLVLMSTTLMAGGGWPQPKGKGYFKLSEWWVVADQHYTSDGGIDPNITTGLYNTTFYAEVGVTDRFTIIANVPLLSRAVVNNQISQTTNEIITKGAAINSPGDVDFSLKYGFFQNNIVSLSGSITFGIPLGEKAGGPDGNLQTGDGELNQYFRVDAGFPLGGNDSFSAYANLYGGFNKRNKGFSNEIRYGAEAGIGIVNQKLWLTTRLDVIQSQNNKKGGAIEGSFFANNSEVTSVSAEVSYLFLKDMGASFSYGTAIDGKIIYASPSYSVGVFIKV